MLTDSKSSPMATLAALATEQPRPPQRAGDLRPALNGLLQKDPNRRADAATAERLLRVNGHCVQVGNTGAGSQLFTSTCDGSAFQQFTLTRSGDLVSAAANKCVDIPAGDRGDGVLAQLWSCNGSGNQKWRH